MRNKLPNRYDAALNRTALAAARALVRCNLEPKDYLGGEVHAAPLDPASARPLAMAMLRRHVTASAWALSQVILWARDGSDEAHEVLGELAHEYANRREQLPGLLAAYTVEQFHPSVRRRPGPDRAKSFGQDVCVAVLVQLLTQRLPLRPTRSGRSSVRPSACSIMSQALSEFGIHRGGETAVQKIWLRYRDLVTGQWDEVTPEITDSFWLGRILTPPRRGDLVPAP